MKHPPAADLGVIQAGRSGYDSDVSRRSPKLDVVRALFARSGNRCAFPGCTAHLVNERNLFVGQICHIEAAEPGGERYNPQQTDDERRDYQNLILMCYPHHVETNDIEVYTVERLKLMKEHHERGFLSNPFKIDESLLYKVTAEMEDYWERVDKLHRLSHQVPDLAIQVDTAQSYTDLSKKAKNLLPEFRMLADLMANHEDEIHEELLSFLARHGIKNEDITSNPRIFRPYSQRNWEPLVFGFENTSRKLSLLLMQMELQFLADHIKVNPRNQDSRRRLDLLKDEFEQLAVSAIHID